MELEDPSGYGRVLRGADGNVERVVETKAAGDATEAELSIREVNAGLYVFDGGALLAALSGLEEDNAQGELYLPDVLPALLAAGESVQACPLPDPDLALGVNDRVDLAHVTRLAQQRIHRAHQRAGVTIVNPESTHDRRVRLDRRGHHDRALELPARHDAHRRALHRRAAQHADRLGPRRRGRGPALLPRRRDRGRRRHDRPVRLPAPEGGPAGERQGRHVRRDQELHDRPRLEGPAPVLRRRHGRRRGIQPRRGNDHRQLRRPPASTAPRSGTASGSRSTRRSSRPSTSATTPTPRPAR